MVNTLGRLHTMITWLHEVTWLIKNNISPLPWGLWLPHLTMWRFIVNDHHALSHFTLWSRDHVITWQMKTLCLNFCKNMATKLDRVVGFIAGVLPIKSHNLLMTWSHKVTWQMKNAINPLSRDLSLSNLT